MTTAILLPPQIPALRGSLPVGVNSPERGTPARSTLRTNAAPCLGVALAAGAAFWAGVAGLAVVLAA